MASAGVAVQSNEVYPPPCTVPFSNAPAAADKRYFLGCWEKLMSEKNWFKVETMKEKESTYHYYGSSPLSHEQLVSSLQRGEYIHLDDLLYIERGEYKEWAEWDKSLIPSVSINPACIVTVMQYKGNPRAIPAK